MINHSHSKTEAKHLVEQFLEKAQYHEVGRYLECLDSLSPEVRLQGIQGLKRALFYTHDLAPLLEDPNSGVRKGALLYFKSLGGLMDTPKVERLLEDPQDLVRAVAVEAVFALSGNKEQIEPFLKDASPEVRFSALKAVHEELTDDQITPFLQDFSEKIRHFALEAKIARSSDSPFLRGLLDTEPPASLKKKILRQLSIFDPGHALDRVKRIIQDPSRPLTERKAVIPLMQEFPPDSVSAVIDPWIEDPKTAGESIGILPPMIRLYGVLKQDQPSRILNALSKWVEAPDETVKEAAVRALSRMKESFVSPVLRKAMEDISPKVRSAAVDGLASIPDYFLAEQIPQLLNDFSEKVRKSGTQAIGKLQLEEYYPELIERVSMKKEDHRVRMAALAVCRKSRITDALDAVSALLMDETEALGLRSMAGGVLLALAPNRLVQTLQTEPA